MKVVKPLATGFSIHAFKEGHPRAFSYVFDHYYSAIRFFAGRLLQDAAAAEDIAQETFIKLWEKHSSFHSPQAIKSFLYVTARNACFNSIKKLQTGDKNHKLWSGVWDECEDHVLNQLTRSEVVREIYVILNVLPPECRKVMHYYFIEGKENHEIASLLNISVSTVKNQKTRAIYLIRKKLGNRALVIIAMFLMRAGVGPAPDLNALIHTLHNINTEPGIRVPDKLVPAYPQAHYASAATLQHVQNTQIH